LWRFIFCRNVSSFKQKNNSKKKDSFLGVGVSFNPNFDGNALAWYDGNLDLSGLQWDDQGAGGHDILFTNNPSIISGATPLRDAVRFNGTDESGQVATPAINQPSTCYIVLNQITWTVGDRVFGDGVNFNFRILFQDTATPNLSGHAGSQVSTSPDLALGTWGVIMILYDGVNSEVRTNLNVAVVGDIGANNGLGVTLAARQNQAASFANVEIGYLINRTGADSTATQDYIIGKLRDICGLTF